MFCHFSTLKHISLSLSFFFLCPSPFNFSSHIILFAPRPLPSSFAIFPSPSHLLLFSLSFNTRKPVTMAAQRELQINFPAPCYWMVSLCWRPQSATSLLPPTLVLYWKLSHHPAKYFLQHPQRWRDSYQFHLCPYSTETGPGICLAYNAKTGSRGKS